jgi:hypothetical protein
MSVKGEVVEENWRLTIEEGGTVTHLGLCFLDAFLFSLVERQVVFRITVELSHDVRVVEMKR